MRQSLGSKILRRTAVKPDMIMTMPRVSKKNDT